MFELSVFNSQSGIGGQFKPVMTFKLLAAVMLIAEACCNVGTGLTTEDVLAQLSSIFQRSPHLRLAFMKKLLTVDTSSPSCLAIWAWDSLEGRWVSWKMALKVRLWMSVKTRRDFLLILGFAITCCSSSFFLQAKVTQKICFD